MKMLFLKIVSLLVFLSRNLFFLLFVQVSVHSHNVFHWFSLVQIEMADSH